MYHLFPPLFALLIMPVLPFPQHNPDLLCPAWMKMAAMDGPGPYTMRSTSDNQ